MMNRSTKPYFNHIPKTPNIKLDFLKLHIPMTKNGERFLLQQSPPKMSVRTHFVSRFHFDILGQCGFMRKPRCDCGLLLILR
jgi:hypothetical protein